MNSSHTADVWSPHSDFVTYSLYKTFSAQNSSALNNQGINSPSVRGSQTQNEVTYCTNVGFASVPACVLREIILQQICIEIKE